MTDTYSTLQAASKGAIAQVTIGDVVWTRSDLNNIVLAQLRVQIADWASARNIRLADINDLDRRLCHVFINYKLTPPEPTK